MSGDEVVFSIFLIFSGAAVLSTFALFARQSLLVAYIVLGVLLGPSGLSLVSNVDFLKQISNIGIIFLLFLLGLNLYPQKLFRMFKEATLVTLISGLVFAGLGFLLGLAFGFGLVESLLIGGTFIFSSTIIGLKLLPTTVLHHQKVGALIISILLLQDLVAIIILLLLHGMAKGGNLWIDISLMLVSLPALGLLSYLLERYLLIPLLARFDTIQEYVFLIAIGWCLSIAELAHYWGLSHEIGAFIAGVSIATSPISPFIAENLKPLRDFFLVMFFFALGASFNLQGLQEVWFPALVCAGIMLAIKPIVFRILLSKAGELRDFSWEIGFRLGQISEFSLLIVFVAFESNVIGERASDLIQLATLLTFIFSSYLIVLRYPSPIAVSPKLRRD